MQIPSKTTKIANPKALFARAINFPFLPAQSIILAFARAMSQFKGKYKISSNAKHAHA